MSKEKLIIEHSSVQSEPVQAIEFIGYGAYLIKDKATDELQIMIKNSNGLNFLENNTFCGFNAHYFKDFFNYYIILGRISQMKISNIELTDIKWRAKK